MQILKQYENRQMSLQVARTEVQTEEVVSSRPWTDADESMFKINELVDVDLRSNATQTQTQTQENNIIKKNVPITKTVNVDLNDNYKPTFPKTEKLFASKQFNNNGENLNERKTVADNSIPGLSFNVTVKRS